MRFKSLALLFVLLCFGCGGGDTYYIDKPVDIIGPGIYGQYLVCIKNIKNTCADKSSFDYVNLIKDGKVMKEFHDVFYITPQSKEETEVYFRSTETEKTKVNVKSTHFNWSGFELDEYGANSYELDMGKTSRAQAFVLFENKLELVINIRTVMKGSDIPCELDFLGLGEKFVSYTIVDVPDSLNW